ncbi:MAG: DNA primase [Gammaproteobacteria bacterium]
MAGERVPQAFIDEVLARTDLVALIGTRVDLKKSGRDFTGRCPFHEERTPSFTVSPTKQFYHCFGCGAHGSAVGFLMAFDRVSFPEALESLAHEVGLELPDRTRAAPDPERIQALALSEAAAAFFGKALAKSTPAGNYLAERGVGREIAERFRLGYAPGGQTLVQTLGTDAGCLARLAKIGLSVNRRDRFRNRIMFPIRNVRGEILGFGGRAIQPGDQPKYLNSPETPFFHKGSELYGLYEARAGGERLERLIVVEGYLDVIALAQAGVTETVATLGTALTAEQVQKLVGASPEVVFCFDGDPAGRRASFRALETALPFARDGRNFRFLGLPDGEDPDSFVRREGAQAFHARLARSRSLSEAIFFALEKRFEPKSIEGRAALAREAQRLTGLVRDPLFRELLVQGITERFHLPGRVIATPDPVRTPSRSNARSPSGTPRIERGRGGLVHQLLAHLLHQPRLIRFLPPASELQTFPMPGLEHVGNIQAAWAERGDFTTGRLLEYFRETPTGEALAVLAAQATPLDEEASQEEVLALIDQIRAQNTTAVRLETLLARSRERDLTTDEKKEIQALELVSKRSRKHPGAGTPNG